MLWHRRPAGWLSRLTARHASQAAKFLQVKQIIQDAVGDANLDLSSFRFTDLDVKFKVSLWPRRG